MQHVWTCSHSLPGACRTRGQAQKERNLFFGRGPRAVGSIPIRGCASLTQIYRVHRQPNASFPGCSPSASENAVCSLTRTMYTLLLKRDANTSNRSHWIGRTHSYVEVEESYPLDRSAGRAARPGSCPGDRTYGRPRGKRWTRYHVAVSLNGTFSKQGGVSASPPCFVHHPCLRPNPPGQSALRFPSLCHLWTEPGHPRSLCPGPHPEYAASF